MNVLKSAKHTPVPYPHGYEMASVAHETVPGNIPSDLLVSSDTKFAAEDRLRLHTTQDSDPISGYTYTWRERLLVDEKAAERLGILGVERLDEQTIKILRIQRAIADVVVQTPLVDISKLADGNVTVLSKEEAQQKTGAFKIRGAYNRMRQLSPQERENGVIAASAGNHAQGVALSASLLGIKATLIVPKNTPQVKIDGIFRYGAKVELCGDNFDEAKARCDEMLEANRQLTYISPYDDQAVIDGQATIAAEILQQSSDVSHIFVPVGGGGLLAGVAEYIKRVNPDIKVISVEPEDSAAFAHSYEKGERIELSKVDSFADGAAVKQPGGIPFEISRKYLDEAKVVSRQSLAQATVDLYEFGMRTEPAGALALAGIRQYLKNNPETIGKVIAIRSGGNVDDKKIEAAYSHAGYDKKRWAVCVC